jgi:hypothetical protein
LHDLISFKGKLTRLLGVEQYNTGQSAHQRAFEKILIRASDAAKI